MISWGYEEIKAIKKSDGVEYKPNKTSLSLFLTILNLSIFKLQCSVSFSCTANCLSYSYIFYLSYFFQHKLKITFKALLTKVTCLK